MLHLRIVTPPERTEQALAVLDRSEAVCNEIVMRGAARRPPGDVILCDVAREDASIVLADLRELGIPRSGSIAIESVDTQLSEQMDRAVEAARGSPADAVVWEEVEERTSETAELSFSFLAFIVLAALIASVGIFLDSEILVVGAMVVGPEFGPIAGFCVAAVQRRRALAARSLLALTVGFPVAIGVVVVGSLLFRATGLTPDEFAPEDHALADIISRPDFFAFFVAFCAGTAGMLSLSTAKSSALIGVFISITTIPAAANVGVAAAYGDWSSFRGSLTQLGVNLGAIVLAGTTTLALQRVLYGRRRRRHLARLRRAEAAEVSPPPPAGR